MEAPTKPAVGDWSDSCHFPSIFLWGPHQAKSPLPVMLSSQSIGALRGMEFWRLHAGEGAFGLALPQRRRHAWANKKCRPGTPPINGWEVRVLRAVSKMENFGVRKVIPPRFPIFERTSSPPSENPKAPGTSGIGDSQKNRYQLQRWWVVNGLFPPGESRS